jgi:hypothetical protein
MKWGERIFLLCLLLLLPLASGLAQQVQRGLTLQGTVVDEQNRPVETAYVILNGSYYTLTDAKGRFTLKNLPAMKGECNVSCVGYESKKISIDVQSAAKKPLVITLQTANLALKQVTVTAKQEGMGSRSEIGQDAIRHIQAKSIGDVLQLMPGALTVNPTLNNLSQAYVREIGGDDNNALGTQIIVDGAPLSNDANLQMISQTKYGNKSGADEDGMSKQTTVGRGVDLRTVSPDNIESVEVIRGIPSAEYGNLTSGIVIVKTKAGRTPLEAKFKADPFSKLAWAGKGFNLRSGGAVNLGFDWSQSYADQRQHYKGYERITATAAYSNILATGTEHPVTLNAHLTFHSNINNYRYDPQMAEMGNIYKNRDIGGSLAVNGNVRLGGWLNQLDYALSATVARQVDDHSDLVHSPNGVVTYSRENGLALGRIFNQRYRSSYRIEGVPINLYLQLKTGHYFRWSDTRYTNLKVGVDYRMDDNRGEGFTYDENNPPQSLTAQTTRPRSYKDIPALHNLSAFAEARTAWQFGSTSLRSEVGVRLSNLFLNKEKAKQSSFMVAEPRINLEYIFLNRDNNSVFDKLSVTGGFGISNKMPTLSYLYPNTAYFDAVSLNRVGSGENASMGLVTTTVVPETQNPDLKPANALKWELGLNARLGKMNGYVTFFHERHKHEYGYLSHPITLRFRKFSVPSGSTNLEFDNPNVYYTYNGTRQTAAYEDATELYMWSQPFNTSRTEKYGIEYSWNFGTFEPLQTSLNVDGAWFHIKRQTENDSYNYVDKLYPYVGLMPAGNGSISDRVNTNFRFITHIPKAKLVFTTTVQVVWYESARSIYEDSKGNPVYRLNADGTRYTVTPIGFYDVDGKFTQWEASMAGDLSMQRMLDNYHLYSFKADRVKPWAMLNFRLTKEFGRLAELSFMANNFLNLSKYHVDENSFSRSQIYPDLYFGAELKLKF